MDELGSQYNIDHINNFLIEFLWVFDVCVSMTTCHGSDFDGVLIAETSFIADDYRRLWTPIFLAQHSVPKWEKYWTLHFFSLGRYG